ncbi:DegT/DnrJ/EryC1/StrS aminotransferase family protein [Nocardia vinacea]|uniref:DegT/DnrJ/EryC1/StrS family aminotransferase n=1 Tax=Nocardia vinacea TaxID=96468 RepID=UPI0033C438D0
MIPPFVAELSDDEIQTVLIAAAEILRSGRLVLGPYTCAFEMTVAAMAGTRHAVAVNSGSTALEIVYRALAVRGKTVLIPTNTNYATAAAALQAGAKVSLYDSGLYPNVSDIEQRLTADVAAVVVVHIGGYISPDLPQLAHTCHRLGVALIEDAAHAHGSTLYGVAAGGFGRAAAFSFFPTKTITTGEGGALVTDDSGLAASARMYRDQGKDHESKHVVVGGSWRITEIGAALGSAQLDHLHRDVARRRAIIDRYTAGLSNMGLTFPDLHGLEVSGYKCVAMLDDGIQRDALRKAVAAQGVQLGRGVYEQPLHTQPVFADLNVTDPFPTADDFTARHICLPLWRFMTDETVERVIEAIRHAVTRLTKT